MSFANDKYVEYSVGLIQPTGLLPTAIRALLTSEIKATATGVDAAVLDTKVVEPLVIIS
jgi:hypothetical protein